MQKRMRGTPVLAEELRRIAVTRLLGSPDLPPALPPAVDDAAAVNLDVATTTTKLP
jgi:hypothetical protein